LISVSGAISEIMNFKYSYRSEKLLLPQVHLSRQFSAVLVDVILGVILECFILSVLHIQIFLNSFRHILTFNFKTDINLF